MKLRRLFCKNKAFTLVELIMTIVVVGIIALPISITIAKQVQSVYVSQDYTLALNLARLEMEKIINTDYLSIANATTNNYQGYSYNVATAVSEVVSGAQAYKIISISVTKSGSATVLVTLKNYIVNNVTWGL